MTRICPCCTSNNVQFLKNSSEYDYYQCLDCSSLFKDVAYLKKIDAGFNIVKYEEGYWNTEMESAKERSYGAALARMAELNIEERGILQRMTTQKTIHTLPPSYYAYFPDPQTNFCERKDLLFVGGFNYQPNVDAVLWFAREIFPIISNEIKNVKFIVVGSNPPSDIMELASDKIEILGYVKDAEIYKGYRNVKLIAIPLRYGAGFKVKTTESMHHVVPSVTICYGIEGLEDIKDDTPYFDTAVPFANDVIKLYTDEDKLREFSSIEVEYARKYLSKEKNKSCYWKFARDHLFSLLFLNHNTFQNLNKEYERDSIRTKSHSIW